MIRKARYEFILSAMLAMTFCVILLIGTINLINYRRVDAQLDHVFEQLTSTERPEIGKTFRNSEESEPRSEQVAPKPEEAVTMTEDRGSEQDVSDARRKELRNQLHPVSRLYKGRYYRIALYTDTNELAYVSDDSISNEDALELAERILEVSAEGKDLKDYKYSVHESEDGERLVIFVLDCSSEYDACLSLLIISIIMGLGSLLVIFIFIYYMSGKVAAPLQESMDKQKQFITDASHELKTPVSVISTNMEILKMDLGTENEWIDSTQRQIVKLRKLISHLVSLAKMEEMEEEVERINFSLSEAVRDCVDVYEAMAETDGKRLITNITSDLIFCAEEKSIREMLTILFENAVKYALDDSDIFVSLTKEGRKIVFTTENAWARDVDPSELERLFERFYRGDRSRNRDQKNSGYGLGLSIAQNAAKRNKGTITVSENKEKHLIFKAIF